ncbi:ATP-dependent Clp protease ATP-binding subunit ClpB, partial [Candidatus Hakubella thermalkaliphila]
MEPVSTPAGIFTFIVSVWSVFPLPLHALPVYIKEPSVEDTISIRRGLKEKYEVHHGVKIKDSALISAATLSRRYISDRFLPDKAIDLIDESASKLRMEIDSMPVELDEIER